MPASLSGEPTVTIICAQVAQPSYGGIPTQTVRYNKLFPCLRIMTPMLTARTTEDNIVPNRHLLSSTQCRPISHFEDDYYLKNKPGSINVTTGYRMNVLCLTWGTFRKVQYRSMTYDAP